jgi:hypothetical protein
MTSIFLVNPISGRGHLDAYARLYSRALLELGHHVVLLAEADGGTSDYLARNVPGSTSLFSFVSFNQARRGPARSGMPLLQRARLVRKEEGPVGPLSRLIRVPFRWLMSRLPQPVAYQADRIWRAPLRHLLRTRPARALGLHLLYSDVGRIRFESLLDCVDGAAAMPGLRKPELVFFLYLDLMAQREKNTACLDRPGSPPWIGIQFHPRLAREPGAEVEGFFQSKTARGGAFLVPSAMSAYAKATPHLHFALVPDVADLELPAEPTELAREVRKRAGNRTIVLQIGSITAHKGVPTLLDVIAAADPARFFFALIGKVYWETFGEHRSRSRFFYANPPENVYLSEGYIASERDYNSIIDVCDIIYAVYQGFGSSSNSLTKAAGFRRPILVAENSLMGERVHRSKIGALAPEGDVSTILEKLGWLAAQPNENFDFKAFHEEQSVEALKSALFKALAAWLSSPDRGRGLHINDDRSSSQGG